MCIAWITLVLKMAHDKKTQNQVLLDALRKGPVTFLHAYLKLGIGCPTKRISELKKKHNIVTDLVEKKTRWGKSVIARWMLLK